MKYSIVIVENDEDEQFFMKEGFESSNLFTIIGQPANGNELIEWLDNNPQTKPDLILSDLNMHGKNGYDIINYIKEHPIYRTIPVVITSTSTISSVKERCLNSGANGFLPKPDTFIDYRSYVATLYDLMQGMKV
ncbi:MAG: response regulator [Flavitalea sp.]